MARNKIDSKAPCGVKVIEFGEVTTVYPNVLCEFTCDGCAWNPNEMERRKRTGKWVSLPDGTMQFTFVRKSKVAE